VPHQSIRDLMNEDCIIPDWLHDIFLGYGDPGAAQWFNLPGQLPTVDFKDTFLDVEHVQDSFPQYKVGGRRHGQISTGRSSPAAGSTAARQSRAVQRWLCRCCRPLQATWRVQLHVCKHCLLSAPRLDDPDQVPSLLMLTAPCNAPPPLSSQVEVVNKSAGGQPVPPFRITFPDTAEDPTVAGKQEAAAKAAAEAGAEPSDAGGSPATAMWPW
jgi:hypothetical protein